MDTTGIQAFSPPHPMVYMHFRRPFTLRVHIMLAQRQFGEMAAVLTQNGIAKGLSMQIQEINGMTLLSQGSWFWLLRREVNFKSLLHRIAKARCTATLRKGRSPFQGNGLLSWLMTAYATIFVEYQITDKTIPTIYH